MSEPFQSEHYPPGCPAPAAPSDGRTSAGFLYRRGVLNPDAARDLATTLKAQCAGLRRLPARRIIRSLAALHAEWARPRSPLRDEAVPLLHRATGYPTSVLDASLRRLFAGLDAREMEGWLEAGGVPKDCLDAPCPVVGGALLVFGPALTLIVASGNIPGAALPSVVQALLLKSPCLVKTASEEPVLLPLYARSLAASAPDMAQALAVTGWERGREDLEDALLAEVEALVVYGSDAALRALRHRLPLRARFLGYGHRISFSALGREQLTREKAREAALLAAEELWTFDQQGCLSPQAIYMERGGEVGPEKFAGLLADAMEAASRIHPRRPLSPAESAAIHQFRAAAEMRALSVEGLRVLSSREGTAWTVVLDDSPAVAPCPLNRTVVLRPVDRLEQIPEHLAAHRQALISAALGVSGRRYWVLGTLLAEAGVTRVTRLGRAQAQDSALHHDGLNAVAALARFVRVESEQG